MNVPAFVLGVYLSSTTAWAFTYHTTKFSREYVHAWYAEFHATNSDTVSSIFLAFIQAFVTT